MHYIVFYQIFMRKGKLKLTTVQIAELTIDHGSGALVWMQLRQGAVASREAEGERIADPGFPADTSLGAIIDGNASQNEGVVTGDILVKLGVKLAQ